MDLLNKTFNYTSAGGVFSTTFKAIEISNNEVLCEIIETNLLFGLDSGDKFTNAIEKLSKAVEDKHVLIINN